MGKHHPTPNDNRSRSINRNDAVGQKAQSNHDKQVAANEAAESSE